MVEIAIYHTGDIGRRRVLSSRMRVLCSDVCRAYLDSCWNVPCSFCASHASSYTRIRALLHQSRFSECALKSAAVCPRIVSTRIVRCKPLGTTLYDRSKKQFHDYSFIRTSMSSSESPGNARSSLPSCPVHQRVHHFYLSLFYDNRLNIRPMHAIVHLFPLRSPKLPSMTPTHRAQIFAFKSAARLIETSLSPTLKHGLGQTRKCSDFCCRFPSLWALRLHNAL